MAQPCPVRAHRNGLYYVARWTTTDGEPRARSLGRVSRREAERLCWDIAAEFVAEPGKRDARGAPTLGEWAKRYPELRPDLGEQTLALHDRTLRYLSQRLGESRRLDRITPADADDWRLWLRKQPNGRGETLTAQTIAAHIRNAKVTFALAKRRRLIGANPFDELSGAAPAAPKDWRDISHADLERILGACPGESWRCLFALARLAGLRRGEAVRLTWGDIDWTARRLRITPEGEETTKQRARDVPIAPRLLEILQASWESAAEGSSGPCDALGAADLHRRACAILKKSGVGTYSKPFHSLRKALENEWKQIAPWPTVCSWLGHSAKVAAEHYLRPGESEFERVTGAPPLTTTESDTKLRA